MKAVCDALGANVLGAREAGAGLFCNKEQLHGGWASEQPTFLLFVCLFV